MLFAPKEKQDSIEGEPQARNQETKSNSAPSADARKKTEAFAQGGKKESATMPKIFDKFRNVAAILGINEKEVSEKALGNIKQMGQRANEETKQTLESKQPMSKEQYLKARAYLEYKATVMKTVFALETFGALAADTVPVIGWVASSLISLGGSYVYEQLTGDKVEPPNKKHGLIAKAGNWLIKKGTKEVVGAAVPGLTGESITHLQKLMQIEKQKGQLDGRMVKQSLGFGNKPEASKSDTKTTESQPTRNIPPVELVIPAPNKERNPQFGGVDTPTWYRSSDVMPSSSKQPIPANGESSLPLAA